MNDISILNHISQFLNPFANLIGLDGVILMAFILAFPANEILIPIILMTYLAKGELVGISNLDSLRQILIANGWTYLTAINIMLFSLLHWPCSTTLMTIKKETGSWKWTFMGFIIPTLIAILVCLITTFIYRVV